ncbi:MAG: hypothetical protein KJ621_07315 [Proteobacteria bacterium]|nr:hypothetical protein [Pseudomonadota bacterium]
MFQASELMTLILGLIGLVVVWHLLRCLPRATIRLFKGAYLALLGGYVFTVVEGVWLADFFNLLEHLGYAVAGLAFALACWRLPRDLTDRRPESGD